MCIMIQIRRILPITFPPGKDLYSTIRGVLITRGTNLNQWCKTNNLRRQSVEKALKGQWRGRKADALREHIILVVLDKPKAA